MDELGAIVERDAEYDDSLEAEAKWRIAADRRYLLGLLRECRDHIDPLIRIRHDQAHNGDIFAGGDYDHCPLCALVRALLARLSTLGEPHE